MREAEFRAWLEARRWNGKPIKTISLRMSRARRFERAMPTLGLGKADLDASFDADGLEQVSAYLRDLCRTVAETKEAPAVLVGDTTIPVQRINSLTAAVRNYRQFREAEAAPAAAWPALEELREIFLDRVPEFERFDRSDNAYERIERLYKDTMIAEVRTIVASDTDDETAGRRIFRALIPNEGPLLRWQTDDDFARRFPALAPAFYAAIGRLARDTGPVVDAIMAAADTFARLRREGATTLTFGEIVSVAFSVAGMARPTEAVPFKISKAQALARLLTGEPIFTGSTLERRQVERWLELLRRIEAVMRDEWEWHPRDLIDVQGFAWTALDDKWKVDDEMDDDALLARFDGNPHFRRLRDRWSAEETAAFCKVARQVHAAGYDWYHVDLARNPTRFGRKPDVDGPARAVQGYLEATGTSNIWFNDTASSLEFGRTHVLLNDRDVSWFARTLEKRAADIADWKPLKEPRAGRWPDESGFESAGAVEENAVKAERLATPDPTNLILYGPPGCGKTYATARRAVALVDGAAEGDRDVVRSRYDELVSAGQVRFVTFHQSYAYEDFVEGRQPMTGTPGEEGGTGTGFRLETVPGVFREIASVAEQAMKSAGAGAPFDVAARQVFKMSLGRAGSEDAIFDAAIEGDYVVLGWGGDIDWTPYDDYDAIFARWNEDNPGTNGSDGNISQLWRFRCSMRVGDLVVVSYGNSRFRAIGEIVGDYEFAPTEVRDYNHRRRVRWLFVPPEPLPISFYDKPFTMRSCYLLREDSLNREALALLLPGSGEGQASAPRQFVLIIDEINRANISKVFGELITLIERDKRLGMREAMRLKLPYSKQDFGVPANLHIVGTMNTADRSIALLDTALRRRFSFEELMPDPSVLTPVDGIDLPALLRTLNERIEYLFDREHQIGHAYFLPRETCATREAVDDVMRHKVIPLLAEYFFEDWTKVAAVLGDVFEDDGSTRTGGFLVRQALRSPLARGDGEDRYRYRWSVREPARAEPTFDYARLTGAA